MGPFSRRLWPVRAHEVQKHCKSIGIASPGKLENVHMSGSNKRSNNRIALSFQMSYHRPGSCSAYKVPQQTAPALRDGDEGSLWLTPLSPDLPFSREPIFLCQSTWEVLLQDRRRAGQKAPEQTTWSEAKRGGHRTGHVQVLQDVALKNLGCICTEEQTRGHHAQKQA